MEYFNKKGKINLLLWNLSQGRAYTLNEISNYIKVSVQTTEDLLSSLLEKDKLLVIHPGRKDFYRIKNTKWQKAIYSELAPLFNDLPTLYDKRLPLDELRTCRKCYHHLAGKVGVQITDGLQENSWIAIINPISANPQFLLTEKGKTALLELGADFLARNEGGAELAGKACLDFSERRWHIGGKLGQVLLNFYKQNGWIIRQENSRVHFVTPKGKKEFKRLLDLDF